MRCRPIEAYLDFAVVEAAGDRKDAIQANVSAATLAFLLSDRRPTIAAVAPKVAADAQRHGDVADRQEQDHG